MNDFIKLLIILTILFSNGLKGQESDTLHVAFWNLENLFDTLDDPDKDDQEFLPGSEKDWTDERLDRKLYNLGRVINSINYGNGPDILGVCEVEHQYILDSLISGYLNNKDYRTVYSEAPDNRGIDNGLIYNSNIFSLISFEADTVTLSDGYPTRLILNATLLSITGDTIVVFINHWPSRRGGQQESEKDRISAASVLREKVDKYLAEFSNPKILIMGDFNDEPNNFSLLTALNAHPLICDSLGEGDEQIFGEPALLNVAYSEFEKGEGSYKYRDDWNLLDQIIISDGFLEDNNLNYLCGSFMIYKPEFMITKSGKYEGTPFPVYGGSRYLGGYSDHFPVIAKFLIKGN